MRAIRFPCVRQVLLVMITLVVVCCSTVFAQKQARRARLPKPRRLDAGIELRRDARSGELRLHRAGQPAASPAPTPALRVGVNLVQVNCNVQLPDGSDLRGLSRADFRVYENGIEQNIVHFDASSEAASIALVIDASPSIFHDLTEMKTAARTLAAELSPLDDVAVVAFDANAYLLLPFSHDRELLAKAIEGVNIARGPKGAKGSNIYEAAFLAAHELFPSRTGRKAVVLITDGQDSGLGLDWNPGSMFPRDSEVEHRLTFEDVARALAASGVEVEVVSTQPRPRAMTDAWLEQHRGETLITSTAREAGMPHYTLYLAEFVRRVGGHIYFLRELETLSDVYRRIAANLRAQYTLGYYPGAGVKPGWRVLRVDVPGRADARTRYRAAYYAPVGP